MRIVLVEPDIPQNVGAAIRAAACFGASVEIIGPCGFPIDSREVRRVAMDYGLLAPVRMHAGWRAFRDCAEPARLVLLTTRAEDSLWDFRFAPGDAILLGRESAGAPEEVRAAVDAQVKIPMAPGARSLNVAVAAAVALAEARRQLAGGRPACG